MAWLQNRSDLTKAMAVKTTEEILVEKQKGRVPGS